MNKETIDEFEKQMATVDYEWRNNPDYRFVTIWTAILLVTGFLVEFARQVVKDE